MFCRMEEHFVLNEEKRTLEAKLTETVECYFQINRGEFGDFVLTVQEKINELGVQRRFSEPEKPLLSKILNINSIC